jgi:hypothetical protein
LANPQILRDNKGRFINGCKIAQLNKGVKKPVGFGDKISRTRKGIKLSIQTKGRISASHIGLRPSFESRLKNSETNKKIAIKGDQHKWWKGGHSKHHKEKYYTAEYKQWRLRVFYRDGFACQRCKIIGGYLTAHHIKSFTKYPELRFAVDNGITFCEDCHKQTDNYKGRGK